MVTNLGTFAVPAGTTFGRDGAMFEGLLAFVAQMSLVLWGMVTLTVVIRFIGIRFYRRAARRAMAKMAAAGTAVPAIAVASIDASAAAAAGTAVPDGQSPGTARAAGAAAAQAAAAAVMPAIAVVPAIAAGIDLLQLTNVPLPEALTNVLAANSVDG
ncbi:hypothetical protein NMQ03_15725 [Arthrobacter sp. DNA4]|uniref:hypothetical protein n=1 Tax=Arthrobacter sp. DNA4 TaxID=2963432 RepID=UPI0020CDEBCD|nr:hypothetical protein [Arthrobacter sp. DNA4]UTT68667.1 hypothetical protein NMQ03_15725 [Arthrobacter sp. DNA4]